MNPSLAGLVIPAVLFGCSAGGSSRPLDVGTEGTGGSGSGGSGSSVVIPGDAGLSNALSAHIESPPGVTVEIVTLSCEGACADVIAVAKGGTAPYSYTWEDGSANAARHVCPSSTTRYQVSVTDTGRTAGEIRVAPQTAHAPLTAEVLTCPSKPDAGKPDGGKPSIPFPGGPCVSNGSFVGTPFTPLTGLFGPFEAPPWVACASTTPDIYDATMMPLPPTDGPTALHLVNGLPESVSEQLCAPLLAGKSYALKVDAYALQGAGAAARLSVFGGAASCGKESVLWESPPIEATWKTYCFAFTPDRDLPYLTLEVPGITDYARVIVDNLVAVESCP